MCWRIDMKVYVINEINYEYNDEYYARCGLGTQIKAFRHKVNADREAVALNQLRRKQYDYRDSENKLVTEYYVVTEIEVAEDDIEIKVKDSAAAASSIAANIFTEYNGLMMDLERHRAAALRAARTAFETGSAALFATNPKLESFGWRQYTPHFNDGDTCYFGVYADEPDVNGLDGYEISESDNPEEYIMSGIVADFLSSFANTDMESMFGDHVRLTRHRDGTLDQDDYEHD